MIIYKYMNIDRATEQDIPEMVRIYNEASVPYHIFFEEELKENPHMFTELFESLYRTLNKQDVVCCKINNQVVGYGIFSLEHNILWIRSLYIDPQKQNQGVGTYLLKYMEEYAQEKNATSSAFEVFEKANWALSFYQKNDYQEPSQAIKEEILSRLCKNQTPETIILIKDL